MKISKKSVCVYDMMNLIGGKVMKRNLLIIAMVISMFLFLPAKVDAAVKEDSFQETIEEEISTFDGQEGFEQYVETLKNTDLSDYKESNDKVNVYIFRGSTCSHCLEAVAHFAEIAKEDGKYFNIKTYEVWSNSDNQNLMNDAADEIGDSDVGGVPYIIIGNKSWIGYAESYDDEMMRKIKSEYESSSSDRYDVMDEIDSSSDGAKNIKQNDDSSDNDSTTSKDSNSNNNQFLGLSNQTLTVIIVVVILAAGIFLIKSSFQKK